MAYDVVVKYDPVSNYYATIRQKSAIRHQRKSKHVLEYTYRCQHLFKKSQSVFTKVGHPVIKFTIFWSRTDTTTLWRSACD